MAASPQFPFEPFKEHPSPARQRSIYPGEIFRNVVDEYAPAPEQPLWRRIIYVALATISLAIILPNPSVISDVSRSPAGLQPFPESAGRARPTEAFANVWMVESTETHDVYSNGLRIENTYALQNEPRFYQVLDRTRNMQPGDDWRSEPVGIVYHTTESPQAPFDRVENDNLQRLSKALFIQIQQNRSYNFVIDRFGRVFRVVQEADAANHSGNSIWADGDSIYLNLNSSFLAIAFEAATDPETGLQTVNASQIHAGRILTQVLRSKYKISPQNCVTHAQVSVNPFNMRIGYHTDWASNFPFGDMGLPNNYDIPLSSLIDFGFGYDELFAKAVGPKPWRGLRAAERQVERNAAARKLTVEDHQAELKEKYRKLYAALKLTGALDEAAPATRP